MKLFNSPKPNDQWLNILAITFLSSLALSILSFLTYKSIFNVAYGLTLLCSLILSALHWNKLKELFKLAEARVIILACMALPLSILLAQSLRMSWMANPFDGPIRLTLSLAIIFSIYYLRINFLKLLEWLIPISLLAIYAYAMTYPGNYLPRITNPYVDPIIWGNFCMVLGLMMLFSINKSDRTLLKLFKLVSFAFGAYLSVLSQSRAGWLAGLILLIIFLVLNRKELGYKKLLALLIASTITCVVLYQLSPTIHGRVDTAIAEVHNWMSGTQKESSSGYRLTMWKMSLYLLSQAPFTGYGDHQLLPYLSDPYILSFADAESIKTIQCCGPHNEIMAHSLRSGVWGLIAILASYLLPIIFYIKNISSSSNQTSQSLARVGLSLSLGLLICAFLSEMLSLKFIYSYYSLVQAGIIGAILWNSHEQK